MKLGLGHQNSLENRRLAIDMAAQLVLWEKQTLETPPETLPSKRSREEANLQVPHPASLLLFVQIIMGSYESSVKERMNLLYISLQNKDGKVSLDCW